MRNSKEQHMEKQLREKIREQLKELADEKYRVFAASLLPGTDNILGVRLPLLRKLAREIARGDWRGYLDACKPAAETSGKSRESRVSTYLQMDDAGYFEELLLKGMVIGYAKADTEELLNHVAGFVPEINNWSVCDSFCAGLKFAKNHKERVWSFLQPYFISNKEYEVRFGIVMLLNFYICEEYIKQVLQLLDSVKHEGYYAKMAAAWAISMCYVKQPEKTMEYLKSNSLDDFTYNKALQKITESYSVDKETRDIVRSMKRRTRQIAKSSKLT